MTMYCFYQEEFARHWQIALSTERSNIIKTKKPALISVLDADCSFEDEDSITAEDIDKVKYIGPAYVDLDGDEDELGDVIDAGKTFVLKLKDKGVQVNAIRIFASGGKGLHFEIPITMLMQKAPQHGFANLPWIYREFARQFDVGFCDYRVYSRKRGRMWRCPNVLRDNGKYKVPISADELLELTPETYAAICSSPRNTPPLEEATYSPELGLMFSLAKERIDKEVDKIKTRRAKGSEAEALKTTFKGEWPETLKNILNGAIVDPDAGWNRISMQVALAAYALGKGEEDLLKDAQPLFESHKSDSSRYNTVKKRRRDLREMYRYVGTNPSLEYSAGGILSIVLKEVRANCDVGCVDSPDNPPTQPITRQEVKDDGTVEVIKEEEEEHDNGGSVQVRKAGIYQRVDSQWARVCDIGIADIVAMMLDDTRLEAYEVGVYQNGKYKGRFELTTDCMMSRQSFQAWTLQWGSSMKGSELTASTIADVLTARAALNNDVVYAVTRQGLDYVQVPGKSGEYEVIWATPDKVLSASGTKYRLRIARAKDSKPYTSDLINAPDMTVEDAQMVEDLLSVNEDVKIGTMVGWFVSNFPAQIIRHHFKGKYPLMQVFGLPSSGKTDTTTLLQHMHHWRSAPALRAAGGGTLYPIYLAAATQGSLPLALDEMKPREMDMNRRNKLVSLLRSIYDGHIDERGALGGEGGKRQVVINRQENVAPTMFNGEALESQTATMDRCVIVELTQSSRYGKDDAFRRAFEDPTQLGKLGKVIAMEVLHMDVPLFVKSMKETEAFVRKTLEQSLGSKRASGMSRPAFNYTVVLMGLDLLKVALRRVFETRFDEKIDRFKELILANLDTLIPRNISEAAKVLDVASRLSRESDPRYALIRGKDYTHSQDGKSVDLKLRNIYAKYVLWQKNLGQEVLYDTEMGFLMAMRSFSATTKHTCPENAVLFDSPRAVVMRMDVEKLSDEGVDSFG